MLGIPQNADSARIDAAYRRKKREAELAQDLALVSRIEAAHSALFMNSLSARLSVRSGACRACAAPRIAARRSSSPSRHAHAHAQGGGPKDKSVRYADREQLFPWAPKYFLAPRQVVLIAAAMFGVIALYSLLLTTNPKGVVPSAMAAFGLHVYRQYQLFPQEEGGQQAKIERGGKNILR